jgi:hypothetical protein
MKVSLLIQSGPLEGQRMRVPSGRAVLVGKSSAARLVIAEDDAMADVHFAVLHAGTRCRLTDMRDDVDTRVNGESVGMIELVDGDTIEAGTTTFRVCIEGQDAGAARRRESSAGRAVAGMGAACPVGPQADPPSLDALQLVFSTSDTGFARFVPADGDPGTAAVLHLLETRLPVWAVAQLAVVKADLPEDLKEKEYLFDWIEDEEVRASSSPLVLAPSDTMAFDSLLGDLWPEDALYAVFASGERAEVVAHLRRCVRGDRAADGRRRAGNKLRGFYIPSLLGSILSGGDPKLAHTFMDGVEAVLLPDEESPSAWQLLARPEFAETLQQWGASCQPSEPPAEAPPEE